jgi:predicted extracellular nuclease
MSGSAVINEFVSSHAGTDTREYIELKAAPNTDLGALRILVIEGESAGWGTIDRVFTPGTTDAGGYWTTGFLSDQLENGSQTILLVGGFSGAAGDDLDTDNDGVLDGTPWTAILDGVGVLDPGAGEFVYGGVTTLTAGFDGGSFTVGGASRIPDGTDTGAAADWVRNDFDLAGIEGFSGSLATGEALNTPGTANATQPPAGAQIRIDDAAVVEGDAGTTTLVFTVTRSNADSAFTVDYATAGVTATAGTDFVAASGTLTFEAGGAPTRTISVTVNGDIDAEPNETLSVTLSGLAVTSGQATLADAEGIGTITDDEVTFTAIAAIQGAGHRSPLVTVDTGSGPAIGQAGNSGAARYNVEGVVSGLTGNGFWMQDPTPDADDATSDGIFVFTGGAPAGTITPGEMVRVLGARVDEFRAGTSSGANNNLTITQLNAGVAGASVQELGGDTAVQPVLIGPGGRLPPAGSIGDPGFASFDPATDAIDFWESLEGMVVEIANPVAISPTAEFRTRDPANSANAEGPPNEEIWVLAEASYDPSGLTPRGAPLLRQDDANPQRIQIDDLQAATDFPDVSVGAVFGNITGIVSYDFQNYEVLASTAPTVATPSSLAPETTAITRDARQLTVASYNVENLDPEVEDTAAGSVAGGDLYTRLGESDDDVGSGKYAEHARHIALNLGAPSIVALQEVQDNDGAGISADVDAARTLQVLVDLIQSNHGVTYAFAYENPPAPNLDGGQPNANIRPAFLYRPDQVELLGTTRLTDPNPAEADGFAGDDFASSRKPLEGVFAINGQTVTVINNHFNSKGGDNAPFGNVQPPVLSSELQRIEQARIVNARVNEILAADPDAKVMVVGDLNDFPWSTPLRTLEGAGASRVLTNLAEALLPETERYGYNFQGNAQLLDQILVSDALLRAMPAIDIVHVNSDLATGVSDHDPSLARFDFRAFGEALSLGDGRDRVDGAGGNDTIDGGAGRDTILGGAGDDEIDGGTGDDRLDGGAGNDLYIIDAGDAVVERRGGGTDTVEGTGDLTLAANVEAGRLRGDGDDALTGNALDNSLAGNAGRNEIRGLGGDDSLSGGLGADLLVGGGGADTLDGGGGADRLRGNGGADLFLFSAVAAPGEADEILDFGAGADRIGILGSAFDPALAPGALDAARFAANAAGTAETPGLGTLVFDTDARTLAWDADGAGGADAVLLATLRGNAALTAADIVVA